MFFRCPSCKTCSYTDTDVEGLSEMIVGEFTDRRVFFSPHWPSDLLVRCPKCSFIMEVPDSDEDPSPPSTFWERLFSRKAKPSPTEDYFHLVNERKNRRHTELSLRLEAWKIDNDPYRSVPDHRKPNPADRSQDWHQNLRKLLQLLPESNSDGWYVIQAECYRELGLFDSAISVLHDNPPSEPNELWHRSIEELANLKNPHVQKLRLKAQKLNTGPIQA